MGQRLLGRGGGSVRKVRIRLKDLEKRVQFGQKMLRWGC